MKKYVLYFTAQILSVLSLAGYYMVGNYIFELKLTGDMFHVNSDVQNSTPFIGVDPVFAILGVAVQTVGFFLFCVCFGMLAKFCKTRLSKPAKHISFVIFAATYILGAIYLFANNFVMFNRIDCFGVKEIWANAVNFILCIASAVFGFCFMYHFKNEDNHLIYKN